MDVIKFIDICGLRPCYKYPNYMNLFPKKKYEYNYKIDKIDISNNDDTKIISRYNNEYYNMIDILVDKYYETINYRFIINDIESEEETSEEENELYYYN